MTWHYIIISWGFKTFTLICSYAGIQGWKTIRCNKKLFYDKKNLKFILKNNRQVFAGFHFSASMMKVDAKEPIMSSNDWVMNGAIGFSVWYSTRHLFNSAAVLARNLKFTVIKGSLIVGNFCYLLSVVLILRSHPKLNCFHNLFPNNNGSFYNSFVFGPCGRAEL